MHLNNWVHFIFCANYIHVKVIWYKRLIFLASFVPHLYIMKTIILAFLIAVSIPSFAFDTWWHAECTRKAMTANGFSSDARLATQVSNYFTDFITVSNMGNDFVEKNRIKNFKVHGDHSYDFLHFDAIYSTAEIEKNWNLIFENTVKSLKYFSSEANVEQNFKQIVLFNILGASLHIVQDFYSHSNWVNYYNGINTSTIPIWFDKDSATRSKLTLYTGVYPDGSVKGKVDHKDLNKDCSTQLLNDLAVETAGRASVDWINRIINAVPEINWSSLKSYNIQKDIIMKKFLVTLDASFVTTSSILARKFDGKKPKKLVFADNIPDEEAKALFVFTNIINDYALNTEQEKNKYKLPTPYWSGFYGYYITRYLANGLKLNGETYIKKK